MLLSNRLSLHINSILQNASALPAYCYASTSKPRGLLKPLQPTTGHINADLQLHYDHPPVLSEGQEPRLASGLPSNESDRLPTELYKALTAVAVSKYRENAPKKYWQNKTPPRMTRRLADPSSQSEPITATMTKPVNFSPPKPANPSRTYWKLGPGLIEKVDRLTGEVLHLVES